MSGKHVPPRECSEATMKTSPSVDRGVADDWGYGAWIDDEKWTAGRCSPVKEKPPPQSTKPAKRAGVS